MVARARRGEQTEQTPIPSAMLAEAKINSDVAVVAVAEEDAWLKEADTNNRMDGRLSSGEWGSSRKSIEVLSSEPHGSCWAVSFLSRLFGQSYILKPKLKIRVLAPNIPAEGSL